MALCTCAMSSEPRSDSSERLIVSKDGASAKRKAGFRRRERDQGKSGKVGVQEQPSWCLGWRASRRPCRPDSTKDEEERGASFASSPRLLCCPRPGLCLGPNHAELRLATAKHLDTEDAEHRAKQSTSRCRDLSPGVGRAERLTGRRPARLEQRPRHQSSVR